MMNTYIQDFPKQLLRSIEIGKQAKLSKHKQPIQNIIVIGVGGSGIGANFAAEFTKNECSVPFVTCKGYELPAFVGPNTLAICSSFSGNTEETLIGYEHAQAKGAKIVCITSGGKLLDIAKDKGLDYIQVPNDGQPPRACLGYSLVQQLFILNYFGFADAQRIEEVNKSVLLLQEAQESIQAQAVRIARFMDKKFPIVYTTERMEAVALRFRQQLNENSKILCCHHVIPEMNHNELVGWREQSGDFAVVIFRSKDDHPRNQVRIKINKEIIGNYTDTVIEIFCKGDSLIEQAMYGVHLGDWVSWELSQNRNMDAVEVKVIDFLKSQLAAADLGL